VTVPVVVPATITLAPIAGSPMLPSVTVPVTVTCAIAANDSSNVLMSKNFFIIAQKLIQS
jgi:hypothetical protein